MKTFKFFQVGALLLALLAVGACTNNDEPDDSYYAENASVYSSSELFTSTSNGGTITFTSDGGEVVINVDCEIDWTIAGDGDWVGTYVDFGTNTVKVTVLQNTEETQRTAAITFKTKDAGVEFATVTVTQNAYNTPTISVASDEWNAPAVGTLTTEIAVTCSLDEWDAKSLAETWLSVEKTSTGISITAAENETEESRTASIVVSCSDGLNSDSATVTVTQDAKAYITLDTDALTLNVDGETSSVAVTSNYDWTCSSTETWCAATGSGSSLTVTASANETGANRECKITITAGDGAENVAEAEIAVTQLGYDAKLMVLEYTVEDGSEITLSIAGDVECTVDWGDGSEAESVTSANPSHTYASAGVYNVTIEGSATKLNLKEVYSSDNPNTSLTSVIQWGHLGLTSLNRGFYYCEALASVPADTDGALSEVTDFGDCFYECVSLKAVPAGLFAYCSKVTDTNEAFCDSGLEEVPEGLLDGLTGCTNIGGIFKNCSSLTKVPGKLFAKCEVNTSVSAAFLGCSALEEVPADLLAGCSSVTDVSSLFQTCTSLKSLPEGLLDQVNAAAAVNALCSGCTALTTIPTSLFDTCVSTTKFQNAFKNCKSLTGESPYTVIDGTRVHLYERTTDLGFAAIKNNTGCFTSCTGLTDYDDIPDDWK